jgi:hypothetical protein
MFTTAARNLMLDANGTTHVSLHTAYSATGLNEASGGSPAYARKAITYGAASVETKAATTQPVFDVPPGTYRFVGRWTAITGGTFLGMEPMGGDEQEFSVDLTAETIKVPSHGYSADQKIVFIGGTVPGGLTAGTVYFVRNPTTDTFQVGATAGGAAINLTSEPSRACVVSAIVEEVFASQGTLRADTQTLHLDA